MKAALYSGLLAISLMNVANAGMPDDWIVKGSGSIVDGASFSLCSDDQKGCLRYKDRNGVNLGWTSGENGFMRIERSSNQDKPLQCGEKFSLFIQKEYLIYERQLFGINLSSRTRTNGYSQWSFDCGTGNVPTNQPLVLKHNDTPIVGCRRVAGINLCWAGDAINLPHFGNVREADKDMVSRLPLLN